VCPQKSPAVPQLLPAQAWASLRQVQVGPQVTVPPHPSLAVPQVAPPQATEGGSGVQQVEVEPSQTWPASQ
jgi:hypothetical protein